ncbi:lymphotoxin-alpha [Anableps anableps]
MEEENSCWCAYEGGAEAGAEAGAAAGADLRCHRSRHIQLQKERHRRRMAQFVAAGLLLLLCGVLAVFLTFTQERPCDRATDRQTKPESDRQSSGLAEKLLQPQSAQKLPSAMLTAPDGNTTNGIYLLWQHKLGEAHIQGGFNYSDGSLVVPKRGLYRVFLQVTYEADGTDCPDTGFQTVSNRVYNFRQGYEKDEPLLTAVDIVACIHGVWKKSLFTSGLFKLDTNDKLRVTSSHPNSIAKNEHQLFFGAELVFDEWPDS